MHLEACLRLAVGMALLGAIQAESMAQAYAGFDRSVLKARESIHRLPSIFAMHRDFRLDAIGFP